MNVPDTTLTPNDGTGNSLTWETKPSGAHVGGYGIRRLHGKLWGEKSISVAMASRGYMKSYDVRRLYERLWCQEAPHIKIIY